jgi:squalene-associated FAD-dependent desaturase
MSIIHVVGAGLAGLSAALCAVEGGHRVKLYEAAPQAGGRCRSFFDAGLGRVIDNGGHILLGANRAAFAFLDAIGGRAHMREIAPAAFPFLDLRSGVTWTLRPARGRLPWWVLSPRRGVPGARMADALDLLRLALAPGSRTVAGCVRATSPLLERLWVPLTTAVMNVDPAEAAAAPLARVLCDTFGHGETACRAWLARDGLSAAFVDPAIAKLRATGGEFQPSSRLTQLEFIDDRVAALRFGAQKIDMAVYDSVVLAIPPPNVAELVPDVTVPGDARAIVNAHFKCENEVTLPGGQMLLGLIGGTAQWLIARGDIVSVTVSAADALVEHAAETLLPLLWADVATALGRRDAPQPAGRLIKEKRATYGATPAGLAARPPARTAWRNLALAGDWTDTGLPATIEGAIRSGRTAIASFG